MTTTDREQQAREWLNSDNGIPTYHEVAVGSLVALLTAQRAKVLEEAAEICHAMALMEGSSESHKRKDCAWMMDQCAAVLKRHAQEQRP